MANFYTYLISSFPALQFGMKPPFSFENFLNHCRRFMPDSDMEIIKSPSIAGDYIYDGAHPVLGKWQDFDSDLRNEVAKIRAGRRRIDPGKFVRRDGPADLYIAHAAANVCRNPSVLEAERMLDQERWRFLDELSFGHYFDIDILIIYALKLLILERWERVNSADKAAELEKALNL